MMGVLCTVYGAQVYFLLLTVFNIAMWYGYSFSVLKLGSSFSPQLAEDLLAPAFFFPSFKERHYFFPRLPSHGKTASLCYEALWLFHCLYSRLAETSLRPRSGLGMRWNIELATFFECLYFQHAKLNFNSHFASLQAWISSPVQCSTTKMAAFQGIETYHVTTTKVWLPDRKTWDHIFVVN